MLIGSGVEAAASKITGVEKTYVVDDAALAQYTTDGYTHAALAAAKQADPTVVLLGQTNVGRDLGAGARVQTGHGRRDGHRSRWR